MPQYNAKMTLNELVYSVIPNLNTAERLVCNTLDSLIESAENPLDVFKRTEQRQAFNLELHRIRMDIKHLLDRYRADVDAMEPGNPVLPWLLVPQEPHQFERIPAPCCYRCGQPCSTFWQSIRARPEPPC